MGVVVKEEYVCDLCRKPIGDGEAMIGRLTLRRAGARGLGRNVSVAFHPACSDKLTRYAARTTPQRRSAGRR